MDDEFLYGVGFTRPILDKHGLSGMIEVEGSTKLEDFFNEEITTPVEIPFGICKRLVER